MVLVWRLGCISDIFWGAFKHICVPGGVLGSSVAGYGSVAAGISEPLPHYSLFLVYFVANYKPHLSHFWENDFLTLKVPKKCDPILVTLLKMFEKAIPL